MSTASLAALTLGLPWNSILADDIRRLHAAGLAPHRVEAALLGLHAAGFVEHGDGRWRLGERPD